MRKQPQTGLDPQEIFLHATAFHKSYDLLSKAIFPPDGSAPSAQDIGTISHPALVLSAFASELYLKCLNTIETNVTPNGHNLEQLFGLLPERTRRELDDLWDTDIRRPEKLELLEQIRQMPKGENLQLDLRYALKFGAEGFVELRYFYEKPQSFFLLAHFPFVLRTAILRRCEHWGSLLPKPSKNYLTLGAGKP